MQILRMGFDFSFTVMAYGEDWKKHRRAFHQHFNQNVIVDYRPTQLKHARAMMRRLLDSPNDLYEQSKL